MASGMDELLQLGETQRKPPLVASASFVQRTSPSFGIDLAFDKQATPPYVTHLLRLGASESLSTLASLLSYTDDGTFRLHDAASLRAKGAFKWQSEGQVSALCDAGSNGFAASSRTGIVGLWDERQANATGVPALRLEASSRAAYLSVAIAGHAVAAGTELQGSEAMIDLWDLRKPSAPSFSYREAHSDDITALAFHPSVQSVLLSASSDALVAISDTRQADEDDSVLGVINTGASVARAGWGGSSHSFAKAQPVDGEEEVGTTALNASLPSLGAFYSVSDMQTLGLWEADGFTELLPTRDVRQTISSSPRTSSWQTEYIIDASVDHSLLEQTESVGLFCGDQSGKMALMEIPHTSGRTVDDPSTAAQSPWSIHCLASGGHTEVVRCIAWDAQRHVLYSGGEDGRICAWSLSDAQSDTFIRLAGEQELPTSDSSVGPARKPLKGSGVNSPSAGGHRSNAGRPY